MAKYVHICIQNSPIILIGHPQVGKSPWDDFGPSKSPLSVVPLAKII